MEIDLSRREAEIAMRERAVLDGSFLTERIKALDAKDRMLAATERDLDRLRSAGEFMTPDGAVALGTAVEIERVSNGWIIRRASGYGDPGARRHQSLVLTVDQLRDAIGAWAMRDLHSDYMRAASGVSMQVRRLPTDEDYRAAGAIQAGVGRMTVGWPRDLARENQALDPRQPGRPDPRDYQK